MHHVSGQSPQKENYPDIKRQDTPVELVIKYAAGFALAVIAFVILGWMAGF